MSTPGVVALILAAVTVALAVVLVAAIVYDRREDARRRCVLSLLADGKEHYGLDLVEASGGLLKRGSVYVTLHRMECEAGLICSRPDPAAADEAPYKRRLYRLAKENDHA